MGKQDTGNDLPVIEANLLTNSMYNHDAWEQFRSGEDYLANPEDYLQYYDCCWLLNDGSLYDQLQAAGWYDGQCCWEQDGDGGWKNCDYCTNCSPENSCARFLDGEACLLACLLACFLQPLAYSSLGVASAWPPPSLVLQLSMDSSSEAFKQTAAVVAASLAPTP